MPNHDGHLTRRDTMKLMAFGGGALLRLPLGLPSLEALLGESPAAGASFANSNIPQEAHTEMQRLAPRGISSFSFTPSNGWVITTPDGQRFARNIPDSCYQMLLAFLGAGHTVRVLAFPPAGGDSWVLVTDRGGKSAKAIPSSCNSKINEYRNAGRQIQCVAFPPAGGDRWVVVADGAFFARNIPDECYQVMRNLNQSPRPGTRPPRKIHHVAFTPSGGWTVHADDYFFARDVPAEAEAQIRTFQGQDRRIDTVAFSPQSGGWSVISNGRTGAVPNDEIRTFEASVRRGSVTETIWERMRWSHVPGVTVACVIDNRIAWSCGYGHLERGKDPAAHPESLFQAASISKVITAIGVMSLVRDGPLGLRDDLRDVLERPITVQSGVKLLTTPTIELLLQHGAGFNVSGYAGYRTSRLPTLAEILAGTSSRSGVSVPEGQVMITANPGMRRYSGGGYQVLQQLIEEQTRQPFASWIKANVLDRFGMKDSFFSPNIPSAYFAARNVATAHSSGGNPVSPGQLKYPQLAAAGMYSTAPDLARMIIAMNRIVNGRVRSGSTGDPIGQVEAQQMFTRLLGGGQGLGFRTNGQTATSPRFRYLHGGTNTGFKALFYGYPNRDGGAGVAVMTNGDAKAMFDAQGVNDGGRNFREAIADAVVAAYGW